MVPQPPPTPTNYMEYLVLTKPLNLEHYNFAKFFRDEDEVISFIRETPHEGFQRDIRVISGVNCRKTTDFDDEDLLDTYVELTSIATHTDEEVE
jgi:hypothetical protein